MASFFSQDLPRAAGNLVGSASSKVYEAASQAASTFGINLPFNKVSAKAPDLNAGIRAAAAGQVNALTDNEMSAVQKVKNQLGGDAQVSAKTLNETQPKAQPVNDHYVKLVQIGGDGSVQNQVKQVVFTNMPDVSENRSVEYEAVAPAQAPGAFQKYKGTTAVQWVINATLVSRTTDEATLNLSIINQLRGWTMPYFGDKILKQYPKKLGAPPPILELSGFRKRMIGPVPTVIQSLSWQFPPDVDYIPARDESSRIAGANESSTGSSNILIPFPVVMKVTITLVETFSTEQFNGFSLADYTSGNFAGSYVRNPTPADRSQINSVSDQNRVQEQPAQVVLPNSLRGGNGYEPPDLVGSGRGLASGVQAGEREAYQKTVAEKAERENSRELRSLLGRFPPPPIVSGGGQ